MSKSLIIADSLLMTSHVYILSADQCVGNKNIEKSWLNGVIEPDQDKIALALAGALSIIHTNKGEYKELFAMHITRN